MWNVKLTIDFAVVTLTSKILSGLYLYEPYALEVVTWYGHWSWCVSMPNYGVAFNLGSVKVFTCHI